MAAKNKLLTQASQTYQGQGKTLDDALADAVAQATKNIKPPASFRVVDITFLVENPITEYSVMIGHI